MGVAKSSTAAGARKLLLHRLDESIDRNRNRPSPSIARDASRDTRDREAFGVVRPTSSTMGSVRSGRIPAVSEYNDSLADRDAEAARALIADSEDAFAVVTTMTSTFELGRLRRHRRNRIARWPGRQQAARPPVDVGLNCWQACATTGV